MADTMQFDLVSPERRLFSVAAREVRLPGSEGDMTAMPGHAAEIIKLRPGLVSVVDEQGCESQFTVSGGFAEINAESVSLLVERCYPRADMTQEVFNEMMADIHRQKQIKHEKSTAEDAVEAVVKLLADMEALGTHIGLDPNQASVPV